jgi:hypothetical protein
MRPIRPTRWAIAFAVATILLLSVALLNGQPLVYYDTICYLYHGQVVSPSNDGRAITHFDHPFARPADRPPIEVTDLALDLEAHPISSSRALAYSVPVYLASLTGRTMAGRGRPSSRSDVDPSYRGDELVCSSSIDASLVK